MNTSHRPNAVPGATRAAKRGSAPVTNLSRPCCLYALLAAMLVLITPFSVCAHVGSPDVFFEGDAGPYHLFVSVRVPQVIPGVAEIDVRTSSRGERSVQFVPIRLTGAGSNLPPVPDLAQKSPQDPQLPLFATCRGYNRV